MGLVPPRRHVATTLRRTRSPLQPAVGTADAVSPSLAPASRVPSDPRPPGKGVPREAWLSPGGG